MCEGGHHPNPPWWEFPGVLESTTNCPKSLINAQTVNWFRLYRFYQNGVMPVGVKSGYGGGVYEQPNLYLQAMELIENSLRVV